LQYCATVRDLSSDLSSLLCDLRHDSAIATSPEAGRRYGGKTAAERRAERREKLLDAALELFGTIGYAATTIEMLCAATRLNPRYFYEEFQTREALLAAVYDRHAQSVLETVGAALERAPTDDPRARLEAGLQAFVDGSLADERAARINYFEMVGVSPEIEAHRRGVLRTYADLIAGQLEMMAIEMQPEIPDRRLAAVALVGATDGLIIDGLSGPGRTDRREIVSTLLGIFAPASGWGRA
jgi:AcrR family transcriptional regulator